MINETRKRGRRYMIFGLVLALFSALLVMRVVGQALSAAEPPPPEPATAVIYVAQTVQNQQRIRDILDDVGEGDEESAAPEPVCPAEIEQSSGIIGAFQICLIPTRFVPEDAIELELDSGQLPDNETLRGMLNDRLGNESALLNLERGTILQSSLLGQSALEPGMREVSIAVDAITSVGWKVRPGQRVDIVVSYLQGSGSDRQSITELFLQNVEVLSVSNRTSRYERVGIVQDEELSEEYDLYQAQDLEETTRQEATVTLSMPLEDSVRLIHMSNFAQEVRLLLRSGEDESEAEIDPVSIIEGR